MDVSDILRRVAAGECSIAEAEQALGPLLPTDDLGYARVDLDRQRRCGLPEVIFGEGKTASQVLGIIASMLKAEQRVYITRANETLYERIEEQHPEARYHPEARIVTLGDSSTNYPVGRIAVVCAGTSDIPVAEEAALTAEWMGARVERIHDAGVAGLHRLTGHLPTLRACRVVVVAAGMEGALPSVVGGLLDCPIIAVPTSIGYGANLKGVTTLLAMMNSCVAGISVVNIDNGFGAGVAAAMINRVGEQTD